MRSFFFALCAISAVESAKLRRQPYGSVGAEASTMDFGADEPTLELSDWNSLEQNLDSVQQLRPMQALHELRENLAEVPGAGDESDLAQPAALIIQPETITGLPDSHEARELPQISTDASLQFHQEGEIDVRPSALGDPIQTSPLLTDQNVPSIQNESEIDALLLGEPAQPAPLLADQTTEPIVGDESAQEGELDEPSSTLVEPVAVVPDGVKSAVEDVIEDEIMEDSPSEDESGDEEGDDSATENNLSGDGESRVCGVKGYAWNADQKILSPEYSFEQIDIHLRCGYIGQNALITFSAFCVTVAIVLGIKRHGLRLLHATLPCIKPTRSRAASQESDHYQSLKKTDESNAAKENVNDDTLSPSALIIARNCAELCFWLWLAWAGEYMGRAVAKTGSADHYIAFAALLACAAFIGVRMIEPHESSLPMDTLQQNELKGIMVLLYIVYSYTGYVPASYTANSAMAGTIFVASFRWVIKFSRDTSRTTLGSFLREFLSLNFLTVLVATSTDSPLLVYWIIPVCNFNLIAIYVFARAGGFGDETCCGCKLRLGWDRKSNSFGALEDGKSLEVSKDGKIREMRPSAIPVILKMLILMLVLTVVLMPVVYNATLDRAISFLSGDNEAEALKHHLRVTELSGFLSVPVAHFWQYLLGPVFGITSVLLIGQRVYDSHWPRLIVTSMAIFAMACWMCAFGVVLDEPSNLMTFARYLMVFWFPFYCIVRNCTERLKMRVSNFCVNVGQCNKEIFVLHYHLLNTQSGKDSLHILPENYPICNLLLVLLLLLLASSRCYSITRVLSSAIHRLATKQYVVVIITVASFVGIGAVALRANITGWSQLSVLLSCGAALGLLVSFLESNFSALGDGKYDDTAFLNDRIFDSDDEATSEDDVFVDANTQAIAVGGQ